MAEELGVRYVLEGSVQKAGEKLRITAQLIDAVGGNHLWAGHYDRKESDVFALQDEIIKRVSVELQIKLTAGDRARIAARGTKNLDAWLLRVQGAAEVFKFTRESTVRARELLYAAYKADPNWGRPLAGIAWSHWQEARRGWSKSKKESIRKGIELAKKAIRLSPEDPLGYMQLGNLNILKGEFKKGLGLREKAVELAPNDFAAAAGFAHQLIWAGQVERALALIQRAKRVSPRTPWWVFYNEGLAFHLLGKHDRAIQAYKNSFERNPKGVYLHVRLSAVYADLDRRDKAREEIKLFLEKKPTAKLAGILRRFPFQNPKRKAWYKDLLARAGLRDVEPVSVKKMKLPLPQKPSIAVLPFTNMSGDKKQEYFADGMTDDLITDLSKISALFVVSRNSSFTYKGKAVKISKIAEDLGVRYVLEGSVRRAGDKVRINAQLIDTTTGGHLWAERYDHRLDDIFALQDAITGKVVQALELHLTKTDKVRRRKEPNTSSPEAYDLVLQARKLMSRFNRKAATKARDLLHRASSWTQTMPRHIACSVFTTSMNGGFGV